MRGMVVNEIDEVLEADDNSGGQCNNEGNRWLVKKMWHMYTAENYSAINRNENCVICRDVDGPRASHTE